MNTSRFLVAINQNAGCVGWKLLSKLECLEEKKTWKMFCYYNVYYTTHFYYKGHLGKKWSRANDKYSNDTVSEILSKLLGIFAFPKDQW